MKRLLLISVILVVGLACASIKETTTWVQPDGTTVTRARSFFRAGMAEHGIVDLTTSGTLHLDLNPKPESTADIITAAANAVSQGAASAIKGAAKP